MHLEVLKSEQKKVFKGLNLFPKFYLVGGTALALQMGHRFSVDFDLFSGKRLSSTLLSKVGRVFGRDNIEVLVKQSGQLSVTARGVKIDFVHDRFPLIKKTKEFQGVKLVSIPEIIAMKAYTFSFRAALKDYVDFYFALKEKQTTLEEVIKIANKKYKNEFNLRLLLEQLIYLEDIKKEKIEFIKPKPTEKQMLKFFEEQIAKIEL